jgi:hypothetical protein
MLKRMRKNIRKKAVQNKESNFHQPFIPVSALVLQALYLTFKNIGKSIHIISSLFLNFFHLLARKPNLEKKILFIQTNSKFSLDPGFVQVG